MQGGAQGCEVHPKGSDIVAIHATFDGATIPEGEWEKIKSSLEEYGLGEALKTLKRKDVPEEDWLAKWKIGFEPFRVGTKFLICPSWYQKRQGNESAPDIDPELSEGRIQIFIEPGMAFGTGLHATTQFCLRALETLPPKGKIFDIGTGSGILAIASLLLEPQAEIVACDIDQVAVDFALTDFELNGVDGRIELYTGSTDKMLGRRFDMLLSNLTCEDIIALLPDYNKMLNADGLIICAGILSVKLPLLEQALSAYPMRITQSEIVGQWAGIVIQKS